MEFPNNLRRYRDACRMNQAEVAKQLNINQAEYSRIEKGRRRIGTHLSKLAEIFGCDEDEILFAGGNMFGTEQIASSVDVYCLPSKFGGEAIQYKPVESKTPNPNFESGSEGVFCIFVNGDKNLPRLKHGDKLFCDPSKTPSDGDICVIEPNAQTQMLFVRIFDGRLQAFVSQLDRTNGQQDELISLADAKIIGVAIGVEFARSALT